MIALAYAFLIPGLPLLVAAQSSPYGSARPYSSGSDPTGGGDPSGGGDPDTPPNLTNWVYNSTTAPIEPVHDSFYDLGYSNQTEYTNGAIVAQRNISVDGTYQGVDNALQVVYRTEDAHGAATFSTASVLIAHGDQNKGRIVIAQIPEEAIYINCAPTFQLFGRSGISEIQSLLNHGYSVVVPDYEGSRGSFTVGQLAGRQILDAARAALKVPGILSTNQSAAIGLWGYGTSAHATGWAAEIAATYAPELPVKAVAVGAYVTNLVNWIHAVNSSPLSGHIVASLLGMATEYKDVSDVLAEAVIPRRRSTLEAAETRCASQNVVRYFEQNITSEFFGPSVDPFSDERILNVYNINSVGNTAPKAGVFVYQGTHDNVVSTDDVRVIVKKYCAEGTAVKYREYPDFTHASTRNEFNDALDYFDDALEGSPPMSSCSRINNGQFD